jgi:copper(I)-binding protein
MLIGLKNPIREGQKVPLTLMVKGADGKEKKLAIAAEVRRTSSD